MLAAKGVTVTRGGQLILGSVTLSVGAGSRLGVVGPNGIGKSTLLRVLAGLDQPDSGVVERAPASLAVGYLSQEPDALAGETLNEYLARRTGVAGASSTLDRLTAELATATEASTLDAYSEALDRYLALGGDDFAARAASVCADLGLSANRLDVAMDDLSGGQAARAGLAAILLSRFDVFLLDEPTNDLDFAGLDRLEGFLAGLDGGVVVVSHDRAFLDRSVSRILELQEESHRAVEYAGAWSEYTEARAKSRSQQDEAFRRYTDQKRRLQQRVRTQRTWSEQGVAAAKRNPKDHDKAGRGFARERTEKQAAKVRASEHRLDRLERVDRLDKPWQGWQLQVSLSASQRSGDVVVRLADAVVRREQEAVVRPEQEAVVRREQDAVVGREHKAVVRREQEAPVAPATNAMAVPPFVLGPVDLEIGWAERVAVLGPNGSGKSTLLRAILGELPLAAGQRWAGPSVVFGQLDQRRAGLDRGGSSVIANFMAATGLLQKEARSLLAKFGLGALHVSRLPAALSPGERTRVILAALMAGGFNCLVLDEPTNHLDLPAIEQLEEALNAFEGTLICVSHDRWLLESVHFDRTVTVEDGTVGAP